MFCNKCGAPIPEDSAFCNNCGAPVAEPEKAVEESAETPAFEENTAEIVPAAPVAPAPVEASAAPARSSSCEENEAAKSIMISGILACAFTYTGVLAIVGLIFALITRSKVKAYESTYGPAHHKAKIGKIMSVVCIPVSIVLTVLVIIYVSVYAGFFAFIISQAVKQSGGIRFR